MTATIVCPQAVRTTWYERALLRAADRIEHFVGARTRKRATLAFRYAAGVRAEVASTRARAEALGAFGMLPR